MRGRSHLRRGLRYIVETPRAVVGEVLREGGRSRRRRAGRPLRGDSMPVEPPGPSRLPARALMPAPVEERLRKRERALGWVLFGLLVLGLGVLAVVLLLALPLIVIAFPLTLLAIVAILVIGRLRRRRRDDGSNGVPGPGPR